MSEVFGNRAIATAHGIYIVQGVDRFAIGGNLDAEVRASVEAHAAAQGAPPLAVIWDDAVLDYRPVDLTFNLNQVFIPPGGPYVAAALDASGRAAVRADALAEAGHQANEALLRFIASDVGRIVRNPRLTRFLGWPEAAPFLDMPAPRPRHRAQSVSVVISYRNKPQATIACLTQLRDQKLDARLEIILVDNQSNAPDRQMVDTALAQMAGGRITVQHLRYDSAFNHSYQCNYGAAAAGGEVLVILSNDCVLDGPDVLQRLCGWALEPGIGTAGPRLMGENGYLACAGLAIAPRPDGKGLRVIEADVEHLAHMVRYAAGASFTCTAVSRANWLAVGGADGAVFPFAHNDADFCLRLGTTGLRHLMDGTVQATRTAGGARWRERSDALQDKLAARHAPGDAALFNPYAVPMKTFPAYSSEAAEQVCDLIRLYRLARSVRDTVNMAARPLMMAFEDLIAIGSNEPGEDRAGWRALLTQNIRVACAAYLQQAPQDKRDSRMARVFPVSHDALARVAQASARPTETVPLPSESYAADLLARQPVHGGATAPAPKRTGDPDIAGEFTSFSDDFSRARHRILVFADAFGPTQQIYFLSGLAHARAAGEVATRIITEEDLRSLGQRKGAEQMLAWLRDTLAWVRPTAVIFSRLADRDCHAAIAAALDAAPKAARILHLDDDLFSLSIGTGVERYREARHPRRIHTLSAIAAAADMILVSTPVLARRMAERFGVARVGFCDVFAGGEPFHPGPRQGPLTIGYFGSAPHNRDLEMVAPALRQIKADYPDIRIELVGSIAKRGVAQTLGTVATLKPVLEHDYAAFRQGMRGWGWDIGLMPLMATPFNAAKTPIKWVEYAQAGIATIASRTEPYLDLADQGAVLTARPDEWHGRLEELICDPRRRHALIDTSNRTLATIYSWRRAEEAFLGLLDRAACARLTLAA